MGEIYTRIHADDPHGDFGGRIMNCDFENTIHKLLPKDEMHPYKLSWQNLGDDEYLDYDPELPFFVSDKGMLHSASDGEAKILLSDFIAKRTKIGYGLSCELSRLLSERGHLVSRKMDRILEKTDWESYAAPQLLLSYLAVKPDGAEWAKKLLDIVPGDARDGLFLACWKIKDRELHSKLLGKFEEWFTEDETWGGGDGEGEWLGRFLSKWLTEGTFTYARLEKCIRWHFRHMAL